MSMSEQSEPPPESKHHSQNIGCQSGFPSASKPLNTLAQLFIFTLLFHQNSFCPSLIAFTFSHWDCRDVEKLHGAHCRTIDLLLVGNKLPLLQMPFEGPVLVSL